MAVIDLSQLPAPQIVDVPDFESLLAERKAAFVALYPADEQGAVRRTLELESEPITKQLQENTYREILLRQRINEAAKAVMVAYAIGGDLDQMAANYNVKRLTVTPADNDAVPPVAAVTGCGTTTATAQNSFTICRMPLRPPVNSCRWRMALLTMPRWLKVAPAWA